MDSSSKGENRVARQTLIKLLAGDKAYAVPYRQNPGTRPLIVAVHHRILLDIM
jgi:hypothetical protein